MTMPIISRIRFIDESHKHKIKIRLAVSRYYEHLSTDFNV